MPLDEVEMGSLPVMYGSMEAEFEVQRTIKRAELTAILCLLKKVIGLIKVHVGNKGIISGHGEEKENASVRKLAMLTCGPKFLEELHLPGLIRNVNGSGECQGAPHKEG